MDSTTLIPTSKLIDFGCARKCRNGSSGSTPAQDNDDNACSGVAAADPCDNPILSNYICAAPDHDGEQDEETGDGLASKMFPFSQREQFAPEVILRLSASVNY